MEHAKDGDTSVFMDPFSCHQDSTYLVAIVQKFMVCTAVLCKLQSCVVMLFCFSWTPSRDIKSTQQLQ